MYSVLEGVPRSENDTIPVFGYSLLHSSVNVVAVLKYINFSCLVSSQPSHSVVKAPIYLAVIVLR